MPTVAELRPRRKEKIRKINDKKSRGQLELLENVFVTFGDYASADKERS